MESSAIASDQFRLTAYHPMTALTTPPPIDGTRASAKLLRDEAESMVANSDPEQVRKLAGGG